MSTWLPIFALTAVLSSSALHGLQTTPATCPSRYYPDDIATTIEISGSSETWSSPSDGCKPYAQVVW